MENDLKPAGGYLFVCIGVYFGEGAHTRQEWVRKDSLAPGLDVAIRVAHILMENTL